MAYAYKKVTLYLRREIKDSKAEALDEIDDFIYGNIHPALLYQSEIGTQMEEEDYRLEIKTIDSCSKFKQKG